MYKTVSGTAHSVSVAGEGTMVGSVICRFSHAVGRVPLSGIRDLDSFSFHDTAPLRMIRVLPQQELRCLYSGIVTSGPTVLGMNHTANAVVLGPGFGSLNYLNTLHSEYLGS
jgi:hypothetical protein